MIYGKKRTAWAITLDYDGKHEILLGLIFKTKKDAIEHSSLNLYKPQYNVVKVQIKEL